MQGTEDKLLQARRLIASGKLAAARATSDSILEEQPRHPGALMQRSRLESLDDHYRLARQYAKSAYDAGVSEKGQCIALIRRLRAFNLIPELCDLALGLPQDLASDPEVAVLVSRQFTLINDAHSALEFARVAAVNNPESADLQASIAASLLKLDRFDEAETHLRESLRLQPGHASALWQLTQLHRNEADSYKLVDELRRWIALADKPRTTALLSLALHRELDRLGDYAESAHSLEQACSSMRKTVKYSASDDERLFDAIMALPARTGLRDVEVEDMGFTPVFIVGMHCSGATMLEQLLARQDEVCPGGELHDFSSQLRYATDHHCDNALDLRMVEASNDLDYAALGNGYMNSVDWRRSGQRFLTDRLPSNFLNIGFILRALPNAKILHISRDPMETCFSILREPFSPNVCQYSYDQTELGGYYRQYFALMRHWRQRFPGRIHDVTHTTLVTNPNAEMKRVANYLGMDFNPEGLDAESGSRHQASLTPTSQRPENPNLSLQSDWEPYREYLTPLAWRLSDVGQRS